MATIGTLDVKVNADLASLLSGLKKAKTEMKAFESALNRSISSVKGFNNLSIRPRVNTGELKKLDLALSKSRQNIAALSRTSIRPRTNTSDLVKLRAELTRIQNQMTKLNASSVRPNARLNNTASAANLNFQNTLSRAATAIGVGIGVNEIKDYADAWTSAGNKIRAASEITGMQTRSLEELNDMANKTRSSFQATVDLYAKLVRSSSKVAASELEIAQATETVTKAFKAGGSTTQEQIAGITQLGQALGSGILQGDELRSIRENAPLIAKAIADEFGVTIGELKKLGEEGELTSDRVFRAIIRGQKQIDSAFNATTSTISDAITKVNNAMTQYIGQADKANGATGMLVSALSALADNFDEIADPVLKVAAVIAAAFVGRAIGGMLTAIGLSIVRLAEFVRAIAAVRTAAAGFALVGSAAGPLGAAIGVAAAAALYFASSADSSSESADDYAESLLNVKKAAEEATGAQNDLNKSFTFSELDKNNRAAEDLADALLNAKRAAEEYLTGVAQIASTRIITEEQRQSLRDLASDLMSGKKTAAEVREEISKLATSNPKFRRLADQFLPLLDTLEKIQERLDAVLGRRSELESLRKPSVQTGGDSPDVRQERQNAWIEEQKSLELRSTKEKEIAKITEKLLKDAKEAGQALSEGAAKVAAGEIYDAREAATASSKLTASVIDVIKGFENFRSTPYWDVNAFRAGFGSDTVTLDDGSIVKVTKGMTVTLEQANRDLERRIGEFQDVIKGQIGSDTFAAMNESQQAALTSIAYNYGSLPERIVAAIQTGNAETVYKAIRGLETDNGGINKGRRRKEADMFVSGFDSSIKSSFESEESFNLRLKQKAQEIEFLKQETALRGALNPLLGDAEGKLSTLKAAQELFTMAQEQGTAAGKELSSVQQLLYGDLSKLTPEARAQAEAMRELANSQGQADAAGQQLKMSQEQLSEKLKESREFAKDVFGGFIKDLQAGKSASEALANALSKVADQLLEVGLNALFGTGQFANAGGGTGGGGGLFGGLFNGLLGGLFGGFRAEGGPVSSNTPYVVGERGPELIVPQTSGVVVPNNQLKPSVGGGTNRIEIDLNTNTDTGVITEIADTRIKTSAPTIIKASVQESQKQTKQNMPGYLANAQSRRM